MMSAEKYKPENLKLWTVPESWAGKPWFGWYYSGVGQSRDSGLVEESNFAVMLRELGGESETVQVVEESHWAVGWIQWIAIHESDSKALQRADELVATLAEYPVLDDSDYSEREWLAVVDAWDCMDLRERIHACRAADISIFAARRDEVPEDHTGSLREYLLGS